VHLNMCGCQLLADASAPCRIPANPLFVRPPGHLPPPHPCGRMFNTVMFMAKGQLVYNGPGDHTVGYFRALGYDCPTYTARTLGTGIFSAALFLIWLWFPNCFSRESRETEGFNGSGKRNTLEAAVLRHAPVRISNSFPSDFDPNARHPTGCWRTRGDDRGMGSPAAHACSSRWGGGEEGVWPPRVRANPADYFMKLLRIDMGKGAKGAENTVAQLRMVCRLLPSWAPLECRDRIPEGEGCYPERCCP